MFCCFAWGDLFNACKHKSSYFCTIFTCSGHKRVENLWRWLSKFWYKKYYRGSNWFGGDVWLHYIHLQILVGNEMIADRDSFLLQDNWNIMFHFTMFVVFRECYEERWCDSSSSYFLNEFAILFKVKPNWNLQTQWQNHTHTTKCWGSHFC